MDYDDDSIEVSCRLMLPVLLRPPRRYLDNYFSISGLTKRVSVAPGGGAGRAGRRPTARRVTLPAATPSLHLNSQAATGGAARGDSCKRLLGDGPRYLYSDLIRPQLLTSTGL
jgi:hypothetical protein